MKISSRVGLIPLMLTVFIAPQFAATPQEDLKQTVTQVLKILDGKKSRKEKRAAITEIYDANFDAEKLGSNTLKSDFKKLDDSQKKEFSEKFSRFVLEFYLDKIDRYNRNKVEFIGEELKGTRATVMTLLEYQGKMAKVNYSMIQKGDRWMVYDFEVEGVRLSSTYRSQFAKVFKEGGFEGLMTEINKLLAKYRR